MLLKSQNTAELLSRVANHPLFTWISYDLTSLFHVPTRAFLRPRFSHILYALTTLNISSDLVIWWNFSHIVKVVAVWVSETPSTEPKRRSGPKYQCVAERLKLELLAKVIAKICFFSAESCCHWWLWLPADPVDLTVSCSFTTGS